MTRFTVAICAVGFLASCGEEPQPTSVVEFMENPVLLDATMVKCVQNRDSTRYDAECINAREAAGRIAAAAEEARRDELEAQSERKREALRQAQERADAAMRRVSEAERLREEAEYLGLLETAPTDDAASAEPSMPGDVETEKETAARVTVQELVEPTGAAPAGNAAAPMAAPEEPPDTTDLEAVREELRLREEEPPQQATDGENSGPPATPGL